MLFSEELLRRRVEETSGPAPRQEVEVPKW